MFGRISTFTLTAAAGLGLFAATPSTATAHDPDFAVTNDLGSPIGVIGHRAYGINDLGVLVGAATRTDGKDYPFVYHETIGFQTRDIPGIALDINEDNLIVGWVEQPGTGEPMAMSCQNQQYELLGTLPGGACSAANAVNDQGLIVGWSYDPMGNKKAVKWENGVATDLGTLGGTCAEALAVNNRGEIVGWAYDPAEVKRAVLWVDGEIIDLGTLGGSTATASAINEAGEIAGCAQTDRGAYHAFKWVDGEMTMLQNLNGPESMATGMNANHIIGWSLLPLGEETNAVFWEGDVVVNLNAMLEPGSAWDYLLCASSINSRQQIAGYGMMPSGQFESFIITPVLAIDELDPCAPGVDNSITVKGATPGEPVYLTYGSEYGSIEYANCAGVALDIRDAKVAGCSEADSAGTATFNVFVPARAEGQVVLMQAVEPGTCRASTAESYLF